MSPADSCPARAPFDTALGVFVGGTFHQDPGRLLVDRDSFAFLSFVEAVGASFPSITYIGRCQPSPENLVPLASPDGRLHPLPHYDSLRDLKALARQTGSTISALWRSLDNLDVVWVFGPHPFALILALLAVIRRRRVVLGVRQNTMDYFKSRLPSSRWRPLLAALKALDITYRLLGRVCPVTAVGQPVARQYGAPRPGVLPMTVSLVRPDDLAEPRRSDDRESDSVTLLTVGRLAPEKNPLLTIEVLARLDRDRPGRYRLVWVGTGPLAGAVSRAADDAGIAHLVELPGFVPYGPDLHRYYRSADVFVHTALTEGSPQVLVEAAAAAMPIVATDVGGVAETIGSAAVLVPPGDPDALARAIAELVDDPGRRDELAIRAREMAAGLTIEREALRVAEFVAPAADPPSTSAAAPLLEDAIR